MTSAKRGAGQSIAAAARCARRCQDCEEATCTRASSHQHHYCSRCEPTAQGGPLCPACHGAIDLAVTGAGHGLHPTCDPLPLSADTVATEIFSIVATAIDNQPRTLQRRIGPSELGVPCDRRIGYKLAGTPPVNQRGVAWKPFIGTAVHEQLADIMCAAEIQRFRDNPDASPRWHVEEKVASGLVLNGEDIDGSTDLYDGHSGGVFDWKITTRNRIREIYRPHGPGHQYETQAHEYGLGWQRRGFPVRFVAIIFLTRDGEFTDRHVWSAPFDEQIALDAHARVQSISLALTALGADTALPTLETGDAYCRFCPWHNPKTTNLAHACPGHPVEQHATPTLAGALGLDQ